MPTYSHPCHTAGVDSMQSPEVEIPLERRLRVRIRDVPGVQVTGAVTLQQRPVDDDGRADRRRADLAFPQDRAGRAVEREHPPGRRRRVEHLAGERRRRPAAARALEPELERRHRPHERLVPGLVRIELHAAGPWSATARRTAGTRSRRTGSPRRRSRSTRRCRRPSSTGRPGARSSRRSSTSEMSHPVIKPAGVRDVHHAVAVGDRGLDRDVLVADVGEELRRRTPGRSRRLRGRRSPAPDRRTRG